MIIQMDTLGKNGRFANQIFQFFFLQIIKKEIACEIRYPDWIGMNFFDINSSPTILNPDFRIAFEASLEKFPNIDSDLFRLKEFFNGGKHIIDISGFFQYHTRQILKYKSLFIESFRPKKNLLEQVWRAFERMGINFECMPIIHLRAGDYLQYRDHPQFWMPNTVELVKAIVVSIVGCEKKIYLASDSLERFSKELQSHGFEVVTCNTLFGSLSDAESLCVDYFVMMMAKKLIISNSSLSFSAAMLNQHAKIFMRPSSRYGKYLEFDPWNDYVLLHDNM